MCEGESELDGVGIISSVGPDGGEAESNEDEDDEDDECDISYFNPVILIRDRSLLDALKHPKKCIT